MPIVSNEIIIGSGTVYQKSRLKMLDNGWLISVTSSVINSRLSFRVKKTPNGEWEDLAYSNIGNVIYWSIAVKGTRIFTTISSFNSNSSLFLNFDATTVSTASPLTAAPIETSSTSSFRGQDLTISDDGNTLHYIWSTKLASTTTYSLVYMSGKIDANGTVVWGSLEVVVQGSGSTNNETAINPSIFTINNIPFVTMQMLDGYTGSTTLANRRSITLIKRAPGLTSNNSLHANWTWKHVTFVDNASYYKTQSDALFVPPSINGLANGRIWFAWAETNSTDPNVFQVATTYSDDGGVTMQTPTIHTMSNPYMQSKPALSADRSGKVFLLWDSQESISGSTVNLTAYKTFSNGTWGSRITYSGSGRTNVTPFHDTQYRIKMITPPVMRGGSNGITFEGEYYAGPSVNPSSKNLGELFNPNIFAYNLGSETGISISSVVEKVNGVVINTYNNPSNLNQSLAIPSSIWSELKYYDLHTLSLIVTDSNGVTNTQLYTFIKTLANNATLSESAKAAKDSKDRIKGKQDAFATQLNLPAGSSFDALLEKLMSGSSTYKQVLMGTVGAISGNGMQVRGLPFAPIAFIAYTTSDPSVGFCAGVKSPAVGIYRYGGAGYAVNHSFYNDGFSAYIDSNTGSHSGYTWIAIGGTL